MSIRMTITITRPNVSIDFKSWPNDYVKNQVIELYNSGTDAVVLSENTIFSEDGLTKTVTTEYASIDDFIIHNEEGSARDLLWKQIGDLRSSLGISRSRKVIDIETGLDIPSSTITARIAELRAEGKIPS